MIIRPFGNLLPWRERGWNNCLQCRRSNLGNRPSTYTNADYTTFHDGRAFPVLSRIRRPPMNDAKLTAKQQHIYNYIRKHIEGKGFPPAIRDICDAFSISSPNGAMCHLKALEKKGFISRVSKHKNKQRVQARGITIPGVSAGGFSLPLKGVVAAGRAIEADEQDDRLELRDMFGDDDLFVVKVKGQSM